MASDSQQDNHATVGDRYATSQAAYTIGIVLLVFWSLIMLVPLLLHVN